MSQEIRSVVDGDGDPVTLIHGVGANLESWDAVAGRLAPHYRVLRMDLRGHGRSAPIRAALTLDDFAADVIAALDAAGIARSHVVGFSLGGMIAQAIALARPERVGKLVLISAVAGRTAQERARVLDRARIVREQGIAAVTAAAEDRWFTPAFRAAHPDRVRQRIEELIANDPVSYAHAYQVFAESDLADRLAAIGHRTLVVTSEHDVGSNTRMARLMHERIRDSALIILPELKHSVLVEASDRIAEILLDFLADGEAAGTDA